MNRLSNNTLKMMAKVYLGNMLNNIELDNDTSEGKAFNKIMDDITFDNFVLEFNAQTNKLIRQIEKELKFDLPNILNLNDIFKLGKEFEELRKD